MAADGGLSSRPRHLPEPRLRPAVADVRGFCVCAYRITAELRPLRRGPLPPQPSATDAIRRIPAGLLPERPRDPQKQSDDSLIPSCGVQRLTSPSFAPRPTRLVTKARPITQNRTTLRAHLTPSKPIVQPTVPVEKIRTALNGYRAGVDDGHLAHRAVLRDGDEVHRQGGQPADLDRCGAAGYFIYLLFTANLAVKVRWPIAKTVGVLLGHDPPAGDHRRAGADPRPQGPFNL